MRLITVLEIEQIAFRLAAEHLSFSEPIPVFSSRFPSVLESCLSAPFQSFGRKDLYPSAVAKTSILFYLLVKNHPFQNGNKRIAMTTLFYALYLQEKWLRVDTQTLYNFAIWVAESPAPAKEEVVRYIEKFLKKHMIEYELVA